MQTTSHFIGLELNTKYFSNIFVGVYEYLKENNIENILHFQNPLSPHITLYYFEKDLDNSIIGEIKNDISTLALNSGVFLEGFNYFFRGEGNRFVMYFKNKSEIDFKKYRDFFHNKYNRDFVEDNNFAFSPHITFLRILKPEIYELHRENIENIILRELENLKDVNINSNNVYLYAVNSRFKEEIQVKI